MEFPMRPAEAGGAIEQIHRALALFAAFRFYFMQRTVRIALHLGNATATADVDGLSLNRYGDRRSHAPQRFAGDGTGLLSSVTGLGEGRESVRGTLRCRIGTGIRRGHSLRASDTQTRDVRVVPRTMRRSRLAFRDVRLQGSALGCRYRNDARKVISTSGSSLPI